MKKHLTLKKISSIIILSCRGTQNKKDGRWIMECKNLFDCIDGLYDKYVDLWTEICNMETPTMHKELVDRLGNYFLNFAKQKGWETEVFENPTGNVVCMTMNANASKEPITFSGHMDTVHPVGSFGSPAVRIDEKNIYGPGVSDCKGGLVAALLAMDALERCGFSDRPVRLLVQSDEEAGSRPINKPSIEYICEKSKDSRAFFNLEPNVAGSACVQRKGIITYTMKIWGVEAHSSLCAVSGANAIAEAAHKILELEKLFENQFSKPGYAILNVSKKESFKSTFPKYSFLTASIL